MKKFDIHRFLQVMKRLAMVRQRAIKQVFLVFASSFLVYGIMVCNPFTWTARTDGELTTALAANFSAMIVASAIAFMVYSSYVISDLKDRQSRISESMLPATNLEKFLARILLVLVVFPMLAFAGFLTADIVQQAVSMLIHSGGRASMLGIMTQVDSQSFEGHPILFTSELVLLVNSFFVLNGMLFRKAPWLKAIIVLIIIGLLMAAGVSALAYMLEVHTTYELYIPKQLIDGVIGDLLNWALILLMYWGAYKLYTRLQVINNRWINI